MHLIKEKIMLDGYNRSIIVYGKDRDKLLDSVAGWTTGIKKSGGTPQKYIENIADNVRIYFCVEEENNNPFYISLNTLPLEEGDTNVYRESYDMGDKQPKEIKQDIIYKLWLAINKTLAENELDDCYCGLIPGNIDL